MDQPRADAPTTGDVTASDRPSTTDLGPADAPAPDVVPADVPCVRTLPGEFSIGRDGGKVAFVDVITLSPPARFVLRRTSGATMTAMCETAIPACASPDMIDVGVVAAALTHPDLTALLDQHTTVLVGSDPRPMDGTVFAIRRGTDTVFVGGSCRDAMSTACTPVPAGVQRAVDILQGLIDQERLRPVCRSALGL